MKTPDFNGETKIWFNSNPLSLKDLKGKVVLVDFWTYSCINCLRTLPFLKAWHDKYADQGLMIVGVHTPEFDFEQEPENVDLFIKQNGINFPVVMDNDYEIWRAYNNRYWPSKYLIDQEGKIQYRHFGEGAYSQTEKAIQTLLSKTNPKVKSEKISEIAAKSGQGKVCYPATPELYAGYARGGPINRQIEGRPATFVLPADTGPEGYYLNGNWTVFSNNIKHDGEIEDFLLLSFSSFEVNAVFHTKDNPYRVHLELDGKPVPPQLRGSDVYEGDRGSAVKVNMPRMYSLIKSKNFLSGQLKLTTNSDDFTLYAFTFGSCSEEAA